jgi:hypothetical protein
MALGWLWLASPFVVIALIAHDRPLQTWVATRYAACRVAGWVGAAMMFLGAALGSDLVGSLMFALGTPLVGLIVFRRDEGNDGGGCGGDDPGPDVPPVDWDELERSF